MTVLSVPSGASFTAVTLTVIVFGVGSRSTPPLAVPPSSCTWNVKVAYGVPLSFGVGRELQIARRDVRDRNALARRHVHPVELQLPVARQRRDRHRRQALAGVSFGSVNPKSRRRERVAPCPRSS